MSESPLDLAKPNSGPTADGSVMTIDEYCHYCGISNAELARRMGTHRNTINRWKNEGYIIHNEILWSARRPIALD